MAPKCLLKINGVSLLEWQLRILKKAGCPDVILVIGTKGECWNHDAYCQIRKLHANILLNFNNAASENTFSLRVALDEMEPQDFLSIDGDVIFSAEVVRSLIRSEHEIAIVSRTAQDPSEPGSKVVCGADNSVLEIGKKLTPDSFPWDIHSGLFKVAKSQFDIFKGLVESDLIRYDTGVLLNAVCPKRHVHNLNFSEGWVNINMPDDKDRAECLARTFSEKNDENLISLR